MSSYNKIREVMIGLAIFLSEGGDSLDPAHDELHSGQDMGIALADEQIQILHAAGWFRSSQHCDCPDAKIEEGEETGAHVATCNAWMIFT